MHRASASRNTELPHPSHRASPLTPAAKPQLPRQSSVLLLLRAQRFCFPEHRATTFSDFQSTELRTPYTELHRSSPAAKPHHPRQSSVLLLLRAQSFSPAGTQCLTSTIHNTQSLCYLPGCFRPQSPTPQAKLCAFARNPPAAQSLHLFQCTELQLLHEQYKDICPIIYKTQQNTKLIIIHRASPPREHSAYLHHTQYTELHRSSPATKPHTPSKALCFFIPLSQNYHLTEISPSGTQSL